jgi:hypothetical protein
MPTAMLMGMGLTPHLASADELPSNPRSGDSCVSRPESPAPSDVQSAGGAKEASALHAAGSPSSGNGTPYPCPTYHAKALADAGLEQTPELLPDQPWVLKTSLLTLTGLNYHGIVKVKTENGSVKDVLKFTATAVDIKDLHQIVDAPGGTFQHVKAAPGSTSTFRHGPVTMYTQELKGNLLGVVPVTFSPHSPPPVNVPLAFFTDATVTQAGQFGGTLTIPGMHGYASTSPQ